VKYFSLPWNLLPGAGRPGMNPARPAFACGLLPLASPTWQSGGDAIHPEDISRLPAAYAESAADALCAPWLTAGEQAELESLEAYLKALADYPGLSCGECRTQEQNGEGPPDCASCPPAPGHGGPGRCPVGGLQGSQASARQFGSQGVGRAHGQGIAYIESWPGNHRPPGRGKGRGAC
jgi:hypothetical protein